jgi:23S rRNA (uracil1939-C5)-methyltransferase
LEDTLWHIGRLRPEEVLPPLRGPSFGYRSRARLSVRWVDKKGGLLVGFRERASSYVAQMHTCPVLVPRASEMLPALRDCLAQLSIAREIPQAELAAGDDQIVWVLRVMSDPSETDLTRLREFAARHGVSIWLQPGGPQTAHRLEGGSQSSPLTYRLGAPNLTMPFSPVDFTQVNFPINRALVDRAVRLLDPQPGDRVADFFCGLGNFSLPLALRAAEVHGIEGSGALVAQAQANAMALGLGARVQFSQANLFAPLGDWLRTHGPFDRILIDPPREGAQALCEALAETYLTDQTDPLSSPPRGVTRRLVMVSCNPATLARDAAILVHQGRWTLRQAGVVNMFPQTAHVESIAVFEPPKKMGHQLATH